MEGGNLRSKVSAGLVSFEAFFLGLQMFAFFLCLHVVTPQTMGAHVWYLSVCVLISYSCKDTGHIGIRLTQMTPF